MTVHSPLAAVGWPLSGTSPPPGSSLRQADRAYKAAIADLATRASLGIQNTVSNQEPITSGTRSNTQPNLTRSSKSLRGKITYGATGIEPVTPRL